MLRTTNAARALHDLSTYATHYVPISSIPPQLPKYVSLDRLSAWHTSALLATAIESVVLPCRLKGAGRIRTTLNDFEAALNTNGNQRIAQLKFSILDPQVLVDKLRQNGKDSHSDLRVGNPRKTHALAGEDGQKSEVEAVTNLDVDLLPKEMDETPLSLRKSEKAAHVFGRVDSLRGPFPAHGIETEHDDSEYGRKRRRLHGMPILERSVSTSFVL